VKQYGCSANTKAWTDNQIYVSPYNETVDVWSGVPINSCATSNASGYLPVWQQMSIVDGTSGTISPTFNYPTTHLYGWLCAGYATKNHHLLCDPPHCPNNSASGELLLSALQRFPASPGISADRRAQLRTGGGHRPRHGPRYKRTGFNRHQQRHDPQLSHLTIAKRHPSRQLRRLSSMRKRHPSRQLRRLSSMRTLRRRKRTEVRILTLTLPTRTPVAC
jgi:hypothetical protein